MFKKCLKHPPSITIQYSTIVDAPYVTSESEARDDDG